LLLWDRLKQHDPDFIRLDTVCGLAYILIGAIGAVALAAVEPPLIQEYIQALGPRRQIPEVVAQSFNRAIDQDLRVLFKLNLTAQIYAELPVRAGPVNRVRTVRLYFCQFI
jgi:hypothetical protein